METYITDKLCFFSGKNIDITHHNNIDDINFIKKKLCSAESKITDQNEKKIIDQFTVLHETEKKFGFFRFLTEPFEYLIRSSLISEYQRATMKLKDIHNIKITEKGYMFKNFFLQSVTSINNFTYLYLSFWTLFTNHPDLCSAKKQLTILNLHLHHASGKEDTEVLECLSFFRQKYTGIKDKLYLIKSIFQKESSVFASNILKEQFGYDCQVQTLNEPWKNNELIELPLIDFALCTIPYIMPTDLLTMECFFTPHVIRNISIIMKHLKLGGTLIYNFGSVVTKITMDIIYFLASKFQHTYIYVSSFSSSLLCCIVFENYETQIDSSVLDKMNNFYENNTDFKQTTFQHQDFQKKQNYFDTNLELDSKFAKKIKLHNQIKTFGRKYLLDKILHLHKNFDHWSDEKKAEYQSNQRKKQIGCAINLCRKYNIPINPVYEKYFSYGEEKVIAKTFEYFDRVYPDVKNVDKSKLLISDVGEYSVTGKYFARQLKSIIKYYVKNTSDLILTDATGGVAGDVINFALYFKKVNAVELSKVHCDILKHNIEVYHLKNVEIYCQSYLSIMKKLKQDIVYLDPPWGGEHYKEIPELSLYLDSYLVEEIISILKKNAILFVVKVPFNFNLTYFKKTLKDKKVDVHKLKKFNIVAVY